MRKWDICQLDVFKHFEKCKYEILVLWWLPLGTCQWPERNFPKVLGRFLFIFNLAALRPGVLVLSGRMGS